jgi:hypothetical protein
MIDIRATRSPVIPAKAGIQYAVALRFYHWRSGILGRPVKPGDDGVRRFARRVESAHRSASVTEIFVEQAVHVEADFLNRFNESARRANHPKVCKAPLAKIF